MCHVHYGVEVLWKSGEENVLSGLGKLERDLVKEAGNEQVTGGEIVFGSFS